MKKFYHNVLKGSEVAMDEALMREKSKNNEVYFEISEATAKSISKARSEGKTIIVVKNELQVAPVNLPVNKTRMLRKDDDGHWSHVTVDKPREEVKRLIMMRKERTMAMARLTVKDSDGSYGVIVADEQTYLSLMAIKLTTSEGNRRVFKFKDKGHVANVPDSALIEALDILVDFRQKLFDIEMDIFKELNKGRSIDLSVFEDALAILG